MLTLGEPGGIGPELCHAAYARRPGMFAVIGDARVLAAFGPVQVIADSGGVATATALPVIDMPCPVPDTQGRALPDNAAAVLAWIHRAVDLCQGGEAAGMVTGPIVKHSLYQAGFAHPGHTEFLAHLCGDVPVVMLLVGGGLRVVPVTIHLPLIQVAAHLSTAGIVAHTVCTVRGLQQDFAIKAPRVALAALNPHAGENGTLGREEEEIIAPAVASLRAQGYQVSGPWPADTLFHDHARQQYDVVLCMYHDQALIPLKTLDFWGGVNVTLGLPFVRTSPDHGAGLDIAGRGIARADSMVAAIDRALQMRRARG